MSVKKHYEVIAHKVTERVCIGETTYCDNGNFVDQCMFDCYEARECNLHSKWIGFPNNGVWDLKCDNCHRIIPFGQTPETMHYCPQCGAKMDV